MAQLNWESKKDPSLIPSKLITDSIVYPQGKGYPHAEAKDRLIFGDNLAVISALLPRYEGKIDLIYADPPFFTNRRYPARIGRGEDSRRPGDWQLTEGYPDDWKNIDEYLDMLFPRLVLMHRLLSPTGSIYLHLDWHANAYARILLDEIFGADRLLNEIVWVYHGPSPIRSAFNRKHDTILAYTKSEKYTFNVDQVRQPYDKNTLKTFASSKKAGFGKVPDLERGKVPEDWWYFPVVARLHSERTGYPTQKPEALLERIILASSNPGDLVADFFSGSGTTPRVASRMGRRYIANDISWRSVLTTQSRLAAHGADPFILQMQDLSQATTPKIQQLVKMDKLPLSSVHLSRATSQITLTLEEALQETLDYWEVDPSWDGKVFRSAIQVARPQRNKPIPITVQLPEIVGENPIYVRLAFVSGERGFIKIGEVGAG